MFFSHAKLLVFRYLLLNGFTLLKLENKPFIQVNRFFSLDRASSDIFLADDDRISTLVRGGPNAHVLTSWLQIQSLQRNDQGTYTCVASNTLGKIEKSCTVTVEGKSIFFALDVQFHLSSSAGREL